MNPITFGNPSIDVIPQPNIFKTPATGSLFGLSASQSSSNLPQQSSLFGVNNGGNIGGSLFGGANKMFTNTGGLFGGNNVAGVASQVSE